MRLRILTVSVLAAAAATLPLAGVASAQPGDRDCADFASQADAQEALDGQIGDPERLDANDDGQACENFDYGDAPQDATTTTAPTPTTPAAEESADGDDGGQVSVIPRGGVDTGDGSGTGGSVPLLVGGVVALGTAAAAAAVRGRAHGVR